MKQHYTAREMLERLVSFPTEPDQSNLDLVHFVKDYLSGHGVNSGLDFNEDGTKASLYATIGPDSEGGVVLSGHSDVVSVAGQDWQSDPWTLTERSGRLHGRGACDMKGFDAVVLAAVPEMVKARLKRPIQIALSRDEEIGCVGAPPMIRRMLDDLPRASIVIVGEPTMMKVVTGHKGGSGLSVHVRGHEVHSSILHTGVSAILNAAKLIDWVNNRNEENASGQPTPGAAVFDPPWTSLHVGTIKGGTAQNITARDCRFGLEYRCVPGDSPKSWGERFRKFARSVETEMKSVNGDAAIFIEPWYEVPPLAQEDSSEAEALARQLTGDNGNHVVSYGTEAGQFQEEGYSVVVCGPGNIAQAHQPNEYIAVEQLQAGEDFIRRLIQTMTE
ncbi:MAG: acetylornithine deacetylase [Rhodobacteraceae bacterium]|nr:acetylornithine deacetylase [Paracoccaceae bacterium]